MTLPNNKFGKGLFAFYPVKLSHFTEKNKVCQKYQNLIRGALTNGVKHLSINKIFQNSNIVLEGSRHPNFMNTFEYGKSFHNESFPKKLEH